MEELKYRLYKKSFSFETVENKNISDVLTDSEPSLIFFNLNENWMTKPFVFAINYTENKKPVKLAEGVYIRGFTSLREDSNMLFLINSEKKEITLGEKDFDIFSNYSNKILLENQYIAVPTHRNLLDEIRDEFYKKDYSTFSRNLHISPAQSQNP